MDVKQWEDKNLSHFSYAVLSECSRKVVLIDPARNPEPYLEYARKNGADIAGIIETHPHADFVSSHAEISSITGAPVYVSRLAEAQYPHQPFDEGNEIEIGKIRLRAINTPGHSPDGVSVLLEHDGKVKAVFTGDTLFIGDCGRPDLREGAGSITATRHELAKQMYHSLRQKLMPLPDDVVVFPAHGAGTLCGKSLSEAPSSTMGNEKKTNWSLQEMSEAEFVAQLLADQPFVPQYFPYDVELNRKGAPRFRESIGRVPLLAPIKKREDAARLRPELWVVDARPEAIFKKAHLPHAINLMDGTKFETWLGSIIRPGEEFYLAAPSEDILHQLIERTAAIGYEGQIAAAFVLEYGAVQEQKLNVQDLRQNEENYTIVDVRNPSEVKEGKPFAHSLSIPLAELRSRVHEVPLDKPIVVHCAGGYRSAAASSLLQAQLKDKAVVLDLGEDVKSFL